VHHWQATWPRFSPTRRRPAFADIVAGTGNQTSAPGDHSSVTCWPYRETLSARLDGEPGPVPHRLLDEHLGSCADCRQWAEDATRATRTTRVSTAPQVPDLTALVLQRLRQAGPHAPIHAPTARGSRALLGLVGAAQAILASPALLLGAGTMSAPSHVAHESGVWNAAVAVAFLAVTAAPRLAPGALPLLGFSTTALLIITGRDLIAGQVPPDRAAGHLLLVTGTLLVAQLAHRQRRRTRRHRSIAMLVPRAWRRLAGAPPSHPHNRAATKPNLTRRGRWPVAAAAVSMLLLSACSVRTDEPTASQADSGHAGMSMPPAPAVVSGPESVYAGLELATPYTKPSFTLTDQTGAPYDFAARTQDRPTLLFFGYTNCPDICPTTLADISIALATVAPAIAEQVQMVFVTTDPARDDPTVLQEYLQRFPVSAAPPFVGLTGTQADIDAAQLAAGVPLAESNGQQHSALVLLYGSDGLARVAFNAADGSRAIAHDLEVVVGT
jgi:protein SCO1/2